MLNQASNRGSGPDESKGRRREQQGELKEEYRRWCAFATRSSRGWGFQPESKLSSQSSSPPGDEAGTGHRAHAAGTHMRMCPCCPASEGRRRLPGPVLPFPPSSSEGAGMGVLHFPSQPWISAQQGIFSRDVNSNLCCALTDLSSGLSDNIPKCKELGADSLIRL